MLKFAGFLLTLLPFLVVVFFKWLSNTPTGRGSGHIFDVFSILFFVLGVGVHTAAPLFLFDVYFRKPENRTKRFLLAVVPAVTAIIWLAM